MKTSVGNAVKGVNLPSSDEISQNVSNTTDKVKTTAGDAVKGTNLPSSDEISQTVSNATDKATATVSKAAGKAQEKANVAKNKAGSAGSAKADLTVPEPPRPNGASPARPMAGSTTRGPAADVAPPATPSVLDVKKGVSDAAQTASARVI